MTHNLAQLGGVQRQYDWSNVSPTVAIIETVAIFENGELTGAADVLETPLDEHVSTDALNKLVRNDSLTAVSLKIANYHVRISGNSVGVAPAETISDITW
ncbi:hypothetical protein HUG10_19935 (plasmid) [Halorarum halophilum]|uniref:Halobacterial output domain-containing protein n=1 Tax=Halorarum halophilum TaxID=2743090 RepID=A0A7D5L328_9EURY|nr:HalOD1 output domain-containing protein [Halobaculum halophilum]QLG29883.1 hypothetical protein HUG10_19935 [Halobaculum halophilum]